MFYVLCKSLATGPMIVAKEFCILSIFHISDIIELSIVVDLIFRKYSASGTIIGGLRHILYKP